MRFIKVLPKENQKHPLTLINYLHIKGFLIDQLEIKRIGKKPIWCIRVFVDEYYNMEPSFESYEDCRKYLKELITDIERSG